MSLNLRSQLDLQPGSIAQGACHDHRLYYCSEVSITQRAEIGALRAQVISHVKYGDRIFSLAQVFQHFASDFVSYLSRHRNLTILLFAHDFQIESPTRPMASSTCQLSPISGQKRVWWTTSRSGIMCQRFDLLTGWAMQHIQPTCDSQTTRKAGVVDYRYVDRDPAGGARPAAHNPQ